MSALLAPADEAAMAAAIMAADARAEPLLV